MSETENAGGVDGVLALHAYRATTASAPTTLVPGTFESDLSIALRDVQGKLAPSADRAPLFQLDAVELLAKKFDGARWLVHGLITRGGTVAIAGEPKSATKTWQGTEFAIAIATGTKAFGEFFTEQGRVAYFYAEDLDVQIRNRIRALLAGADRKLAAGKLLLQPRGTFIDITRDEDVAWVLASIRRSGGVDVLVC